MNTRTHQDASGQTVGVPLSPLGAGRPPFTKGASVSRWCDDGPVPSGQNPFYEAASSRCLARGERGGQHTSSLGDSTRDVSDAELLHRFEVARLEAADASDVQRW